MILLCITAIFVVSAITFTYIHLRKQARAVSEEIRQIPSYRINCEKTSNDFSRTNESLFVDIHTDIKNNFPDKIISFSEGKKFVSYYDSYAEEANCLLKKLNLFFVTPPDIISKFINDYENIQDIIKNHNEDVINSLLRRHKDFFDHCLKYPLDKQQRRSIVSEEDNCLVISSAGSGKTSSIIGKVKYLTEIKGVAPERILLISYTNKAAAELTERLATSGLKGYTFHKLAVDIIGNDKGEKPSICDNADALFVGIFHSLLEKETFKKSILEYFVDYQMSEFERMQDAKRQQLSEQKDTRIKAVFPDMDGKPIYVRSEQEQKICFVLASLGVQFRYEEPYEHPLADEKHSQYKPDFSIYFKKKNETKRIYLEHFGVDEHGYVPGWFAKDMNISYEEANKKYNDGITWKKAAHEKFGTELLTTSSADFHYSDIRAKLNKLLSEKGVPIQEKSDTDLYDLVLPRKSKQEKAFIRLVATFITLAKSSCKPISSVMQDAIRANDERSEYIIKNIFIPVYELYADALAEKGQIDFTDAILQATEICKASHPVEYDYIIVDEFQDISVDRYNFLKALRGGCTSARLYCVGDDWQSIYRFSGSDMALFNQFADFFGATDVNKIETTYRFCEPLVSMSSRFIQRNKAQIKKNIHPSDTNSKTGLEFYSYDKWNYCQLIEHIVASVPNEKTIFLLGRYSFDDYYLSSRYKFVKERNKCFYLIGGRKIEFLTVHKSKGLEADYVIILQCNKDTYGFPSLINDDPVLNYVLTESDCFPYGEERRLFYVAITRAKIKTIVLYDYKIPSVFVDEFLHPENVTAESYEKHPNANKRWTKGADKFLLQLHNEGKSIKYIAMKMGRSQTAISMRLNKLKS